MKSENGVGISNSKVKAWLKKQGYPLEISVAQTFNKLTSLHVVLSHYYKDSDSEKYREIDVMVRDDSMIDFPVPVGISCHMECKTSPGKPWVLFVSQAQPDTWLPMCFATSQVIQTFIINLMTKSSNSRNKLLNLPIYQKHNIAHGITQALTQGNDVTYQAIMGAAKSSIAATSWHDSPEALSLHYADHIIHIGAIAIPSVIIDAQLFECYIDEEGEIHLREIEMGLLHWSGAGKRMLVQIITKSAIEQFVLNINTTINGLREIFEAEMETIVSYAKLIKTQ